MIGIIEIEIGIFLTMCVYIISSPSHYIELQLLN